MIRISEVHKIYRPFQIEIKALQGINLSFEKGEFTAIVGASGSGKSTLLNLIGGLDVPSSGQIWVNEHHLNGFSSTQLTKFRLRYIGFVFQQYNLLPVLNARENLEFVLHLHQLPRKEIKSRTNYWLEKVGLQDRAEHFPHQLSGGQQQRVAIARALITEPAFVLADEPTASLDSVTAEGIIALMAQLNQEKKCTFIFSTHDFRIIQQANRIIRLEDGRVVGEE